MVYSFRFTEDRELRKTPGQGQSRIYYYCYYRSHIHDP